MTKLTAIAPAFSLYAPRCEPTRTSLMQARGIKADHAALTERFGFDAGTVFKAVELLDELRAWAGPAAECLPLFIKKIEAAARREDVGYVGVSYVCGTARKLLLAPGLAIQARAEFAAAKGE